MIRPGHHKPLGTVAVMRFPRWKADHQREPQLGDIAMQTERPGCDPDEVRRAYEVVGVIETAAGFKLHMERVEYGTLPAAMRADAIWHFYNLRRGEQ